MIICFACNSLPEDDTVTHIPFKADEDSRWGLIDLEGNILIENEFEKEPSSVHEGLFSVINDDGLYEFYTAEKKFKRIGNEYVDAGHFSNGLAPVVEKNKPVSFIHKDGSTAFIFDRYNNEPVIAVSNFKEGLAYFKTSSGKYGYIDTKGKVVIDAIYENVRLFNDGLSIVQKPNDENNYVINKKGEELFHYKPADSNRYSYYDFIADGKIFYTELKSDLKCFGIMDKNGNKILKASTKYRYLYPIGKDYFIFENKAGNRGVIDKNGDIIIRAKYEYLDSSGDIMIYEHNGKKGILSYDGTEITEPKYDNILSYSDKGEYLYVHDNDEWILIDKKGRENNSKNFYKISGTYYDLEIHSDYVDIQTEVDRVLKLINKDGSIDKVTYSTTPGEFAHIYNIDYKVSDLKDKKIMYINLGYEKFFKVDLLVEFSENVIIPNYERKWKESYWGSGHWENEITGYSYNENSIPKINTIGLSLRDKLIERKQEVFDAICFWMESNGYTKLSTENEEGNISVYWEKKTSFIIKAGTHFNSTENRISIAIGK